MLHNNPDTLVAGLHFLIAYFAQDNRKNALFFTRNPSQGHTVFTSTNIALLVKFQNNLI